MSVLVVGGAGFIGANVVKFHVDRGDRVTLFDNLSRRGARENLLWLDSHAPGALRVVLGDASRDRRKLEREVRDASRIYHLAGQVAVTTSLLDPVADFEANLGSTVQILEAMRATRSVATLLFSSTNKVYGGLDDLATEVVDGRWAYADGRRGVDESSPLDFHSPYGCSKGGADQYVLDYARVFGLKTIVFRQSCIYGPRQFGVEDQGWIVHFILRFALDRPIRIFGDGRQVRDALYVDDLVAAFDQAVGGGESVSGRAFNIGGGSANSLSLLELVELLTRIFGRGPTLDHGPWRKGDQRIFVSDNSKLEAAIGWRPTVSLREGIERTVAFVRANLGVFATALK